MLAELASASSGRSAGTVRLCADASRIDRCRAKLGSESAPAGSDCATGVAQPAGRKLANENPLETCQPSQLAPDCR